MINEPQIQRKNPEMVNTMVREILPAFKVDEFDQKGETDFNYSLEGMCRFRVNAYHQRNAGAISPIRTKKTNKKRSN